MIMKINRPTPAPGIATRKPNGFTLIEMVVVIGIILILVGIALPAVQSARETARRAQCTSNMHSVMLAMFAYESSWKSFPPGSINTQTPLKGGSTVTTNFSGIALILPFLDNLTLYNSINFYQSDLFFDLIDSTNTTASQTRIGVLVCPSDNKSYVKGITNIRLSAGTDSGFDGYFDGVFIANKAAAYSSFVRGSSNTLAISEKLVGSGSGNDYSYLSDWVDRTSLAKTTVGPDAWEQVCSKLIDIEPIHNDSGCTWMLGGARYTAFFSSIPPCSTIVDCGHSNFFGTGIFSARSHHPSGVNAAMADGSVHNISKTIQQNVWRSMGSVY